jgi:uncharacterized membrane protein
MNLTRKQIIHTIDVFAVAVPLILLFMGNSYWLISVIATATIAILARVFFPSSYTTTSLENQTETSQTTDIADKFAQQLIDGEITVEEYEKKVENTLNSVPGVVQSGKALQVNVDAVLVEKDPED